MVAVRKLSEADGRMAVNPRVELSLVAQVLAPSRNAPCPCGSGAKWKHCCAEEQADWSATRRVRRKDLRAPWRR